jgi:hypothetical protein
MRLLSNEGLKVKSACTETQPAYGRARLAVALLYLAQTLLTVIALILFRGLPGPPLG